MTIVALVPFYVPLYDQFSNENKSNMRSKFVQIVLNIHYFLRDNKWTIYEPAKYLYYITTYFYKNFVCILDFRPRFLITIIVKKLYIRVKKTI